LITHSEEGPDFDPDDPLTVLLRPPAEHLGAPPGHFEAIRRGAARRRLLRAAAGVGATCAVAFLVALPFRMSASDGPAAPSVPLAPPPATSAPSSAPPLSPSPSSSQPPSPSPSAVPTRVPSTTPTSPAPVEQTGRF
jgi:hypothetical protein